MNRLCILILMVMSIMSCMTVVNGSCSRYSPHYRLIDLKIEITCEHDHMEYMVGSVIRTESCEECTCSESGMLCCGFGYKSGFIYVPEGHKIVTYGCDYEIEKA